MLIVNEQYTPVQNITNEATTVVKSLKEALRAAYLDKIAPGYKFVKTLKAGEALRAALGKSNDEFLSNVDVLLKAVGINKNSYTAEVTRDSAISGKFDTAQITFVKATGKYNLNVGDIIYITNQAIVIADKQLTPQGLGLTGVFTKSNLLSSLKKALKNADNLDVNLKDSLTFISDKINNNTEKDVIDLDDMIIHGTKKVLQYELPDSVNLDLFTKSLNTVVKDFGEVIGGIFLLNYLEDAKAVVYDDSFTSPMIDYEIVFNDENKLGISAKAESGGHAPSAAKALKALQAFVTNGEQINGLTFDQFVSEHVKSKKAGAAAKRLFELLTELSSASVRTQYISLVNEYCAKDSFIKKFCKLFGLSSFIELANINDQQFADKFDALCSNDKNFTAMLNLLNDIASGTGRSARQIPDTAEKAKSLSKQQKIGLFIYPLTAYVVDYINKTFGLNDDGLDIISAFIRLAFSHKQVYLGIKLSTNNSIKLTFSFAAMDTGNWKFKCPTSANEPWMQGLSIAMTH